MKNLITSSLRLLNKGKYFTCKRMTTYPLEKHILTTACLSWLTLSWKRVGILFELRLLVHTTLQSNRL